MADFSQVVTETGFLGNLKNAIIGAFFGVILFFGSFVLLFYNEGRPNMAAVAKKSVVAAADHADAALEGKLVSVTGTVDAKDDVGDPDYVKPGKWIRLERHAETYAWNENVKTETRNKLGGGTEEVKTYTYDKKWLGHVPHSDSFNVRAGHENPPERVASASFAVPQATIGAYSFATADPAEVDANDAVALGPENLTGATPAGTANLATSAPRIEREGSLAYVYLGTGSMTAPALGDARLGYTALARGAAVTIFGLLHGSAITPFPYREGSVWLRVLEGTREQAIARLETEDMIIRWLLRAVGFFAMWFGMTMVLGPIHAVANVLPIAGRATGFAIGCITFPIAAVLSGLTIVVSMILHSLIATLVVGVVLFGAVLLVFKATRRAKVSA